MYLKQNENDIFLEKIYTNNINTIKSFIESHKDKIDINEPDIFNKTILYYVVQNGNTDLFDIIIRKFNVDVNIIVDYNTNNTSLHIATLNRNSKLERKLIQYGARCDIKNKEGLTQLELLKQIQQKERLIALQNATKNIRQNQCSNNKCLLF